MRPSSLFLLIFGTLAASIQVLVLWQFGLDSPWAYTPAAVAALAITLAYDQAVSAFFRRSKPKLFLEIAAAVAVIAGVAGLWVDLDARKEERIALREERTERWQMRVDEAWHVIAQSPVAQGNIGQREALHFLHISNQDITGIGVRGVNLSRINLSGANISGADFSNADLSGANVTGADLSGADLSGADLSKAKGLTNEQIKKAFYRAGQLPPKLPPGIDPPPPRDPSERK